MDGSPSQATYTFRGQATVEEGASATRLAAGPHGRRVVLALAIACIVTGAVLILKWDVALTPIGAGWGTAGIGILYKLAFPDRVDDGSRRVWNDVARDTIYTFDPNGIVTATEDITRYVRWHAVTEVRENRQVIVLMRRRALVAFIPRSVLGSPQDQAAFLAFVRAQVGTGAGTAAKTRAAG